MSSPTAATETADGVSVVLTAHPLQRVGAFALASLAAGPRARRPQLSHPEQLTVEELRAANAAMTQDLRTTVSVDKSQDPGGFWLGVAQMLWPNSPLAHPRRAKQSVDQRIHELERWRAVPERAEGLTTRCVLCDRQAYGFFGKRDVPLTASPAYRNTTVPGHEGMALCRGCLLCFFALPYGCDLRGGRASALHSWDERFLHRVTARQVRRTRQLTPLGSQKGAGPYAAQRAALDRLCSYDEELTEGVELLVFTNSNREQALAVHTMERPVAAWVVTQPARSIGLLARAHTTDSSPGRARLAHSLFDASHRVVGTAIGYARSRSAAAGFPSALVPELARVCISYSQEVLMVSDTDLARIDTLARRIAEDVAAFDDDKRFRAFHTAARQASQLRTWLRQRAVESVVRGEDPYVSTYQWRLLFDGGYDQYLHRDLLLIGVLGHLHALAPAWREQTATPAEELSAEDLASEDDDEIEENEQ